VTGGDGTGVWAFVGTLAAKLCTVASRSTIDREDETR
jgi:hypothetical protein